MNVKFYHIRNKAEPRGGLTVAMELDANELVIGYAVAKCHERDNFVKRLGRVKAAGRLKSPQHRVDFSVPLTTTEALKWATLECVSV